MGTFRALLRLFSGPEGGAFDQVFRRTSPVHLDLDDLEVRLRGLGYFVRRSASGFNLVVSANEEDLEPPVGLVLVQRPNIHVAPAPPPVGRLLPKWESRAGSQRDAAFSRLFHWVGGLIGFVTVALLVSGLLMELGASAAAALCVGPIVSLVVAYGWAITIPGHRHPRAHAFYQSVAQQMPPECGVAR